MSVYEVRSPASVSPRGGYSQGIVANGFLYTAGMGPYDPATGRIVGSTIEEQTDATLVNLRGVLAEAGLDFSDVVKTTVHLQERDRDWADFDRAYVKHFTAPRPVRTTVGSSLAGILVEIDLVAALRE